MTLREKRGLSAIIGVVILIALVFAAGIIVWAAVSNMVEDKLEGAGSCVDTFEKISLNGAYTCFDSTNSNFKFSINRADVEINSILVLIANGGSSKSFELTNVDEDVTGITDYPTNDNLEKIPDVNSGKTFICTDSGVCTSLPNSIEIAPIINGKQCDPVDIISDIEDCAILGL